ncbi:hypothetical protein ES707_10072 [subsurface metagenome]
MTMGIEEFLERLCSYSYTTGVWFVLFEGGGLYTFDELVPFVGCSESTLRRALLLLLGDGLVRRVDWKYQAVIPEWLKEAEK